MTSEIPSDPAEVSSDSRGWAAAAQLLPMIGIGFIAPLIIWLIRRDEDPYVEVEAREALNFQLSLLLYIVIASAVIFMAITGIVIFAILGIIAFFGIAMAGLILTIIAGVKTASGYLYTYPAIIRFVGPYRPRQA